MLYQTSGFLYTEAPGVGYIPIGCRNYLFRQTEMEVTRPWSILCIRLSIRIGRLLPGKEHFFEHRSWFFGAQLAGMLFSLLKTLALQGHLPNRMDTAFQFTFCAAAILALSPERVVP
jgi:hypothetical protein